jgi:hypothetical protein
MLHALLWHLLCCVWHYCWYACRNWQPPHLQHMMPHVLLFVLHVLRMAFAVLHLAWLHTYVP